MELKFTKTDMTAIEEHDDIYLFQKGTKLYREQKYEEGIEYYRLAASMGNVDAICNIGYCYLYGRSIPINYNAAVMYFTLAFKMGSIDAAYKLGNLYKNGTGVEKDYELCLYYYDKAIEYLENSDEYEPTDFPSLYYSIGKELMPKGLKSTNLREAYIYLNIAYEGYSLSIEAGNEFYEQALQETTELLENEIFDDIRCEFDNECDCDECNCEDECNCKCECNHEH